jgi:aryl-alcohol dehydrogenase-like predicted oxidoreductase
MVTGKVGMLAGEGGQGLDPTRIVAACDASLTRLGVETIDLYLAHCDDPTVDQEAVAEAFGRLIEAGKVRAIGASNFDAARLASALDLSEARDLPRYEVLQPGYNLLQRDQFEGALQDMCVARGIGATPYYGLANGYLTGKYRTADDLTGTRAQRVQPFMDGAGPAMLTAMDSVAEETGASHAAIALAWLAAQPGVVAPIASATSAAQVSEIAQAMTLRLTDDQIEQLDRAGTS